MGNIEFRADLKKLCEEYIETIKYVNENRLDRLKEEANSGKTKKVNDLIKQYMETGYMNEEDQEAKWIRFVIRVNHNIKREGWQGVESLQEECIKQAKFCRKIEPYLINYNYKRWKKSYCCFLDLCRKSRERSVSPTLTQDFMWHAHLQDYFSYRLDCEYLIGRVITHNTQKGSDDDSITSDLTTCSSSEEVITSEKIKRYYGVDVDGL